MDRVNRDKVVVVLLPMPASSLAGNYKLKPDSPQAEEVQLSLQASQTGMAGFWASHGQPEVELR
jgi:hypothetical protein